MKIVCAICNNTFEALAKQRKFIEDAKNNNQQFLAIECLICFKYFGINPFEPQKIIEIPTKEFLRCPEVGCIGYATFVNSTFYGCNDCGYQWKNRNSLLYDIRKIVKKFSYRKFAYHFAKRDIFPINRSQEPEDYESKVENELN